MLPGRRARERSVPAAHTLRFVSLELVTRHSLMPAEWRHAIRARELASHLGDSFHQMPHGFGLKSYTQKMDDISRRCRRFSATGTIMKATGSARGIFVTSSPPSGRYFFPLFYRKYAMIEYSFLFDYASRSWKFYKKEATSKFTRPRLIDDGRGILRYVDCKPMPAHRHIICVPRLLAIIIPVLICQRRHTEYIKASPYNVFPLWRKNICDGDLLSLWVSGEPLKRQHRGKQQHIIAPAAISHVGVTSLRLCLARNRRKQLFRPSAKLLPPRNNSQHLRGLRDD